MKKIFSLILISLITISFIACSEDEKLPTETTTADAWVGVWLSSGTDVAPLLVSLFNYDSVRVTLAEDKTVILESHVKDGAWSTLNGVYSVTKSAEGSVHKISINYTAFEQEGIIEITSGSPDKLKLEAVQTTPDIGATPRTPESGFGSDPTLGTINIQNYVRVE